MDMSQFWCNILKFQTHTHTDTQTHTHTHTRTHAHTHTHIRSALQLYYSVARAGVSDDPRRSESDLGREGRSYLQLQLLPFHLHRRQSLHHDAADHVVQVSDTVCLLIVARSPLSPIYYLGAIQVFRNAVGGWVESDIPEKALRSCTVQSY